MKETSRERGRRKVKVQRRDREKTRKQRTKNERTKKARKLERTEKPSNTQTDREGKQKRCQEHAITIVFTVFSNQVRFFLLLLFYLFPLCLLHFKSHCIVQVNFNSLNTVATHVNQRTRATLPSQVTGLGKWLNQAGCVHHIYL